MLYLESVNFPAPRLLDVVDGFEVVSFIPGDSGPDGWAPDLASLTAAVIDVQRDIRDSDARLASQGIEPQATWVANGHFDTQHARIAWSESFAAENGLTR